MAPSYLLFDDTCQIPKELTICGIHNIQEAFGNAALRALKAGFKIIEIHAAHGYMIHEFHSHLTNFRKDEYGGSFENRIRFLLEIINIVKQVWPDNYPLFVRISATDFVAQLHHKKCYTLNSTQNVGSWEASKLCYCSKVSNVSVL